MGILKYNDEKLRVVCKEVKKIDNTIKKDIDNIVSELKSSGAPFLLVTGLAANQIGLDKRIIVMKKIGKKIIIMINPQIIYGFIPIPTIDFCASLPKIMRIKKRSFFVKIKYLDIEKNIKNSVFFGSGACLVQHEIDHLNGKLIIDKKVFLKRFI